jgi:hypothetical protein
MVREARMDWDVVTIAQHHKANTTLWVTAEDHDWI